MAKDLKTKPVTPFGKRLVDYRYPDGSIVSLAYGRRALLHVDGNGHLVWKTDPTDFIDQDLEEIVRKYKVPIQAFGGDAQKISNNEVSYRLAYDAFETELLKLGQAA